VFEKHLDHRGHADEFVVVGKVEDFYKEVMDTVIKYFRERLEALEKGGK
jgi:hypothetical protein